LEILALEQAIPIQDLIPQRPPFVLLDEFVFEDESSNHSLFTVAPDHILVDNGSLSAEGLVEIIAQTAAARIGFIAQLEGKPVPLGFIGAVQDLNINSLPAVGASLRTTIAVKHQVFNMTQVRGTVWSADVVVAECDMKIFVAI
jgi:predicted hotdog family 3-hydroxylacyl-ACP dehydratase